MFRIRLDIVNDLNSDQLLEVCESTAHVVVHHQLPHGNPHLHAYIKTDVKENTLRQRFKRKFPMLKSTDYSIKKCDPLRANEYIQYMFNTKHGNQWELLDTLNFDDKLLDDLIQNAKTISSDYEQSKTNKSKGPTIWDLAQEIEDIVHPPNTLEQYVDAKDRITHYNQMTDEIEVYTNVAIKTMRKHRKPYDEFLLRKVIVTAMTSNERGKVMMRQKMLKYFLPSN